MLWPKTGPRGPCQCSEGSCGSMQLTSSLTRLLPTCMLALLIHCCVMSPTVSRMV